MINVSPAPIYLALVHHPVYNKGMEVITTTITNLDLHDLARSARTYGVKRYYVINPLASQQAMVQRMYDYWVSDFGAEYNPNRREAFERIKVLGQLEEAVEAVEDIEDQSPLLVATDAREREGSITYSSLRQRIEEGDKPLLLLFGTGWGLSAELLDGADFYLQPIAGVDGYNHLSVRSAAAIILDRLLGARE